MKKKKIYIFFAYIFLFFNAKGQSFTTVIPYEVYADKMIVKMIINGKEERLIFDTGAGQSSISYEYIQQNNLRIVDTVQLKDVTNTTSTYHLAQINSIMPLDRTVNFSKTAVVVMPAGSVFTDCFNVVGILGSDILSRTICTIDPKTKTITLNDANSVIAESFRYAHSFSKKGSLPIFNILVNGHNLEVLMDSGSRDFMSLKRADYSTLDSHNAVEVIKEGRGKQSIGLAGEININTIKRVHFTDMRVGPAKFQNIITETENLPYSLVGLKFMEQAKVVIDYPKKRIFYVPLTKEVVKPIFKESSFGITVVDNKLTVSTVWENLNGIIEEGDIITHVNGIETGNYVFCDVISGIDILKGSDPKLVTIKTKSGKSINLEYKVNEVKI